MKIEDFITNFKEQLEDVGTPVTADLNYTQAEFWDSLTAMVVKVMIEDEYDVVLEVEDINAFHSIEELFQCINKKSNE